MKVLDPGHEYEIDSIDGGGPQRIVFVKREGPGYPGNVGHHGGTIMQELFRVCIDRLRYVNGQIQCAESQACAGLLLTALLLLESRAARRKGSVLDLRHLGALDSLPPCPSCGHVRCHQHREREPQGSPSKDSAVLEEL